MLAALTPSCCKAFEQSTHSSYQSSPEQMPAEKSSQLYQPQLQLDAIKKSYQLLGKQDHYMKLLCQQQSLKKNVTFQSQSFLQIVSIYLFCREFSDTVIPL